MTPAERPSFHGRRWNRCWGRRIRCRGRLRVARVLRADRGREDRSELRRIRRRGEAGALGPPYADTDGSAVRKRRCGGETARPQAGARARTELVAAQEDRRGWRRHQPKQQDGEPECLFHTASFRVVVFVNSNLWERGRQGGALGRADLEHNGSGSPLRRADWRRPCPPRPRIRASAFRPERLACGSGAAL